MFCTSTMPYIGICECFVPVRFYIYSIWLQFKAFQSDFERNQAFGTQKHVPGRPWTPKMTPKGQHADPKGPPSAPAEPHETKKVRQEGRQGAPKPHQEPKSIEEQKENEET